MKKALLILIVSAISVKMASAQYSEKTDNSKFDKSRLFFGGSFALSFGTYTVVDLTPEVGYRFTDHFAAGVGINYIYYDYKDDYNQTKTTQSYAGLNIFGRFYPIRQFFFQAQPELNYVWGKVSYYGADIPSYKIPTQFVPSVLLGGGAAIPAGNGAITFSILYDVVQNFYSPYYHQAIYGIGFNFGF
jgi:hypothetical protein